MKDLEDFFPGNLNKILIFNFITKTNAIYLGINSPVLKPLINGKSSVSGRAPNENVSSTKKVFSAK